MKKTIPMKDIKSPLQTQRAEAKSFNPLMRYMPHDMKVTKIPTSELFGNEAGKPKSPMIENSQLTT